MQPLNNLQLIFCFYCSSVLLVLLSIFVDHMQCTSISYLVKEPLSKEILDMVPEKGPQQWSASSGSSGSRGLELDSRIERNLANPKILHRINLRKRKKHWTRTKRDENERVQSAYGRGVAFFIGEPCNDLQTCNSILFRVYCNRTTQRCECHEDYPVNIDNRVCTEGLKLGEHCQYSESCRHGNPNAFCQQEESLCKCEDGFEPQTGEFGQDICVLRGRYLGSNDVTTTLGVVAGLVVFSALICLALRLFSKARFSHPGDRIGDAGAPVMSLTMLDHEPPALETPPPSRCSTDYVPSVSGDCMEKDFFRKDHLN